MPRVTRVAKCRVDQGTCSKCGQPIKKGDAYVWWQFAYRGASKRCAKSECYPKPADLTQSEFYGTLYGIQEQVSGDSVSSVVEAAKSAAEELRTLGSECSDKLSNMPDGLQQAPTGELLQNRADECEGKADELEAAADEAESRWEDEELIADAEPEQDWKDENPKGEDESDEDYKTRWQEHAEQHNSDLEQELVQLVTDVDLSIE